LGARVNKGLFVCLFILAWNSAKLKNIKGNECEDYLAEQIKTGHFLNAHTSSPE
jgi:hypothetical protein